MKLIRDCFFTMLLAFVGASSCNAMVVVDFTSTYRLTGTSVSNNQNSNWIGNSGGNTAADQAVAIISFLLPDIGGQTLSSADLEIGISGTTTAYNADLYAIRVDPTDGVTGGTDRQTGSDNLSWGSETLKIQDNFLNSSTSTGVLSLSATGQANLSSYLNTHYAAGEYIQFALAADTTGVGANFNRFIATGPTANEHNLILTPVPEPGTIPLVLLGGLAISAMMRRRRH